MLKHGSYLLFEGHLKKLCIEKDNFFLESSNVSMEIGTMVFKCSVVLIHKSLTLPI